MESEKRVVPCTVRQQADTVSVHCPVQDTGHIMMGNSLASASASVLSFALSFCVQKLLKAYIDSNQYI